MSPGNLLRSDTEGDGEPLPLLRAGRVPALHDRAEIIEGNLNLLKKDLIRRLAPPEGKPKAAAPAKSPTGAPKLYLICDPKDEAAVEALEDYLFAQGLEVMLPAFDGDDADAAALHQDNLLGGAAGSRRTNRLLRAPHREAHLVLVHVIT